MKRYNYIKNEREGVSGLVTTELETKSIKDVETVIKTGKDKAVIDGFIEMYLTGLYPYAKVEEEYISNEMKLSELLAGDEVNQGAIDACYGVRKKLEEGKQEHKTTVIDAEGNEIEVIEVETFDAYPWLATYRGVEDAPKPPSYEFSIDEWKIEHCQLMRKWSYPDVRDQLDYLYHYGIEAWKTDLVEPVKAMFPKE
ncbi:hypothetical protein C942_00513 [Photobacterium marinum]|uniref:Uncharacterized protein n=1 Tax=Photobacterium marinum TaxID=1056511 RepID=L8JB83_9GAMM|nr:hypothetical protein [Photobacterium marinum]ELR66071.1 hypothetical protein C942_00513 [Photobacterium marinum]